MAIAGNQSFSVCETLTSGLNWNCSSAVPGFHQDDESSSFKRCLDGLVLAPWVTVTFLSEESNGCVGPCRNNPVNAECGPVVCDEPPADELGSQITVGNVSMPNGNAIPLVDPETGEWTDPFWEQDLSDKCSSVIKSFQYTFDNTGGATCKVTIMDEKGSSFEYWINKLVKNIECARKVYKMKVEFGWIGLNPSDDGEGATGCNDDFLSTGGCNVNCVPPDVECVDSQCDPGTRPCGARVIARSGPLYFLPRDVNANLQNGRFVYEIVGVDLMRMANEQKYSASYPDQNQTDTVWRFKKAVEELLVHATPSIDFEMFSLPLCGGEHEEMRFWVPPAQGHPIDVQQRVVVPCRDGPPDGPGDDRPPCTYRRIVEQMYSATDGPIDEWKGNNMPLYDILKLWTKRVRADDGSCEGQKHGKGIILNWDSRCPTPRLLMWADPFPTCVEAGQVGNGRCIGTYIVNGGKCSPVISFTPNMKWIFNAAMRSGGNITPAGAPAAGFNNSAQGGNLMPTPCNVSGGRGVRLENTVTNGQIMRAGPANAQAQAMGDTAVSERSHAIQGALPIEAELKVQGDPTIGSVLESIGKTCGIVVINPFFIRDDPDQDESMTSLKTPNCPYWSTVTSGVINEVLTNRNWYIRGVDHQIKEGDFVTSYKVYLPAPGADLGAELPLGGGGFRLQPAGGFAAPGQNPDGADCDGNVADNDLGWLCCDPLDDPEGYCEFDFIPQCPPRPCEDACP